MLNKDERPSRTLLLHPHYSHGTGLLTEGCQHGLDVFGSLLDQQGTSVSFVRRRRNGLPNHDPDERARPSILSTGSLRSVLSVAHDDLVILSQSGFYFFVLYMLWSRKPEPVKKYSYNKKRALNP